LNGIQEVVGSIPIGSTKSLKRSIPQVSAPRKQAPRISPCLKIGAGRGSRQIGLDRQNKQRDGNVDAILAQTKGAWWNGVAK
jgi:hypothetical protein